MLCVELLVADPSIVVVCKGHLDHSLCDPQESIIQLFCLKQPLDHNIIELEEERLHSVLEVESEHGGFNAVRTELAIEALKQALDHIDLLVLEWTEFSDPRLEDLDEIVLFDQSQGKGISHISQ